MPHLPGEAGGGDGELQQKDGGGPGAVVQAEPDVTAAVPIEGAGDGGGWRGGTAAGGMRVWNIRSVGRQLEATAWNHALDEASERSPEADVLGAVDGSCRVDDVERVSLAPQVYHSPHLYISNTTQYPRVRDESMSMGKTRHRGVFK